MPTEILDLIATLPEELREDVARDAELRGIVESLSHRPVPTRPTAVTTTTAPS